MTPTKKVSFVQIPETTNVHSFSETVHLDKTDTSSIQPDVLQKSQANTSISDKSIEIKMCSEIEVLEASWPDVLKCKYYDV